MLHYSKAQIPQLIRTKTRVRDMVMPACQWLCQLAQQAPVTVLTAFICSAIGPQRATARHWNHADSTPQAAAASAAPLKPQRTIRLPPSGGLDPGLTPSPPPATTAVERSMRQRR